MSDTLPATSTPFSSSHSRHRFPSNHPGSAVASIPGIDDFPTGHLPLSNDNSVLYHPLSQGIALSPFTTSHHQNAQIIRNQSSFWDPNTITANTSAALATDYALYDDQSHLDLTPLGLINDFPITTSTLGTERCDKPRSELSPYIHSTDHLDDVDSTIAGNPPLLNFRSKL